MADFTEFYNQSGINTNGSVPQPSMAPQQAPSLQGAVNVGLSGPGLPVVVFAVLALVAAITLLHIE